ncbi:MAG: hypothetical protein MPL62_09170, partial [Alphaproteobacteria bacterium]|nr:hypothetical protein [Alphaproteobacteria bacterium]
NDDFGGGDGEFTFSTTVAAAKPTIGFTATAVSVNEPDSGAADASVDIVIEPSAALGSGKTVTVAIEDTAATNDIAAEDSASDAFTDFTAPSATVNLAASGNTTISIPVKGDNLVESNETFVVALTAVGSDYTLESGKDKITVTITDNDTSTVTSLSTTPDPLVAGGSYTVTATLTNPIQFGAAIPWFRNVAGFAPVFPFRDRNSDGYISAANEITQIGTQLNQSTTQTLTAPGAGESVAFDLLRPASDDGDYTPSGLGFGDAKFGPLTVGFTLSVPAPAANDLSLSVDANSRNEGQDITVTVTADSAVAAETVIPLTLAASGSGNGRASADDITGVFTGRSVTIAANGTSGTATIAVADDTIVEANETFTIDLGAPPTGTARKSGDTAETITITDTDTAALAVETTPNPPARNESFTVSGTLGASVSVPGNGSIAFTDSGTSTTLTFADDGDGSATPNDGLLTADELTAETATIAGRGDGALSLDYNLTPAHGLAAADFTGGTAAPVVAQRRLSFAAATTDVEVSEGDSVTITVTTTVPFKTDGSFNLRLRDDQVGSTDDATVALDYTDVTSPVTFPAGRTSVDVTIATVEDTLTENDEVIIVVMTGVSGEPYGAPIKTDVQRNRNGARARITIKDDDAVGNAVVQFAAGSVSASTQEGDAGSDGTVTLNIESSKDVGAAQSLTLAVSRESGSTLALGSGTYADYTLASTTFTIPATGGTHPLNITIKGDDIVEPDEKFKITLSKNAGSFDLGTRTESVVTITDNDTTTLGAFTTNPDPLVAGATYTLSATLSNPVQWNDGNVEANEIFLALLFYEGAGFDRQFAFIEADDNGVIDGSELTVAVSAAGQTTAHSYTAGAAGTTESIAFRGPDDSDLAGLGITRSDFIGATFSKAVPTPTPTLGFDSATASVTETDASQNLELALTSSAALSAGETVTVAVAGAAKTGSDDDAVFPAIAGTDYTDVTSANLSAGTTHTITIPILGDEIIERSKHFTVTITASGTAYTIDGAKNVATVTVTDNDVAVFGHATDPVNPVVDQDFEHIITIDKMVEIAMSDELAYDPSITGPGGDYDYISFTDDDPADGKLSGDELVESWTVPGITSAGDIELTFSPSAPDGFLDEQFPGTPHTIAIGEKPEIGFSSSSGSGAEGTQASIALTLDKAVNVDTEITVAITSLSATLTGANADITTITSQEILPGDGTTPTLTFAVPDDDIVEGDEILNITISAGSDDPIKVDGDNNTFTYTITSDDTATIGSYVTSPATLTASGSYTLSATLSAVVEAPNSSPFATIPFYEGASQATNGFYFFDADSNGLIDGSELTVTYSVNNFDGTFTAVSLTAPMAGGSQSVSFRVPASSDLFDGLAVADFTTPTAFTASVASGTPTVQFSSASQQISVTEGDSGDKTVTLTLEISDGAVAGTQNVDIGIGATSSTSDVAAESDSSAAFTDFTEPSTTLNLNTGTADTTFTITVHGDELVESDETFVVNLGKISGGNYNIGGRSSATVTILDDDTASLALTADPASPVRGSTFNVNAVLGASVQVPPVSSGVTASSLVFASSATGSPEITFDDDDRDGVIEAGTSEASVTGAHDAVTANTVSETYTLKNAPRYGLAAAKFTGGTLSATTAAPAIVLSIDGAQQRRTGAEGGSATVRVTISSALATASSVGVTLGQDADLSTKDADVGDRGGAASLTLPANATSADYTFTLTEDTIVEGDEVVQLWLVAIPSAPYTITPNSAGSAQFASSLITINDNDTAALNITFSDSSPTTGTAVTITGTIAGSVEVTPRSSSSDGQTNATLVFTDSTNNSTLTFTDADGDGTLAGAELTATDTFTPSAAGAVTFTYALTAAHGLADVRFTSKTGTITATAPAPA